MSRGPINPQAARRLAGLGVDRDDHCTPEQRAAREAFDLEAAFNALPPHTAPRPSEQGSVGVRLRGYLRAVIQDGPLREYAAETLGASRCSAQYLHALRVVLGNQADAERHGYTLELNTRVSFATIQTMRTIIKQMATVGLIQSRKVGLGRGRTQLIYFIPSEPRKAFKGDDAAALGVLGVLYRMMEEQGHQRHTDAGSPLTVPVPTNLTQADLPY